MTIQIKPLTSFFKLAPISTTLSTEEQEGRTTIAPLANDSLNENSTTLATLNDETDIDISKFLFSNPEEFEKFERSLLQRPGSRARSVPAFLPAAAAASNINEFRSSNQMLPSMNQIERLKPSQQQQQQRGQASSRVKTAKSPVKNGTK